MTQIKCNISDATRKSQSHDTKYEMHWYTVHGFWRSPVGEFTVYSAISAENENIIICRLQQLRVIYRVSRSSPKSPFGL